MLFVISSSWDSNVFFLQSIIIGSESNGSHELLDSEQSPHLCPALIAQLVERVTSNDEVAGSTPS